MNFHVHVSWSRVARAVPATAFIAAGALKLFWPESIEQSNWPDVSGLVNVVREAAPYLGLLEILLGTAMLARAATVRVVAARAAVAILTGGIGYLAWLHLSGNDASGCGCFGRVGRLSIGKHRVLNGVLLALVLPIAFEAESVLSDDPEGDPAV